MKKLLYILFFLLMSTRVSAQIFWATQPIRLYIAIDPRDNYHLDGSFATYPATEFGPRFLATPIHQDPTEWLYYLDTVQNNPPWMIYEVYDPRPYYYYSSTMEYINEVYPITQEVLSKPTVGLGLPYYPIDTYHTQSGMETNDPINAQFYYVMVAPWKLRNYTNATTVCANANLDLVPDPIQENMTNPENNSYYEGSYVLEYNITSDLVNGWKATDSAIGANGWGFTINPANNIPEVASSKQNVYFRYRQKAVYNNGATVLYSPWSERSAPIEILPPAPIVDGASIVTKPGCHDGGGGSIFVPATAIHTGFSSIRWILKKGAVPGTCNPDDPNSNCGDSQDDSGGAIPVSGGITISNVPKGPYTLLVLNTGEEAGNCIASYPLTVQEYDALTATENVGLHKDVSCYGGSDGTISITAAGADVNADYYFELRSGTTVIRAEQAGINKSILWEDLPAGTYQANVRNAKCGTIVPVANIVLREPIKASGHLVTNDPTCTSPGNGTISLAAATTGNYEFQLYQNNVMVKTSGVQTGSNAYTFNDLAGGTYRAVVLNSDAPLCSGWDSTVTLQALSPLGITLTSSDSVTCFGGSDGSLQFTANGGTGHYQYTLNGTDNTTGLFTGLVAGTYTVTVTNEDNTCADALTLDATVYQRASLSVQLSTTPISCYGKTDAVISATVNGGSGNYNYRWQQLLNGIWQDNAFWYSTDTKIDALDAGTYRLILTDNNATGCASTSVESTIPALSALQITSVEAQDAVCLADGARINMTATGGTPAYLYEWSNDNGNTYHSFTANTAFTQSGTYQLRLTDAHGCKIDAEKSYTVSLPDQPVSFTYQLSSYAGYNVGCVGGNNGYIDIVATGGNGVGYQGYTYAIDNGAYGPDAHIVAITSGLHMIRVKDNRGCVNSQQVNFTAPASTLSLTVLSKEHNGCGADPIGQITLQTSGGKQPYTYSLNEGPWQSNPTFNNLVAGDYKIAVQDAAGCVNRDNTTLTALYESIKVTAAITDVTCFGLSDGAISLSATGGDGNYNYQWKTITAGNQAKNLAAGDYSLDISDSKGCKQSLTYSVSQPAQLTLSVSAAAICDGLSDGSIMTTVNGGTAPYQYALDQSSWLPSGNFNGLAPGSYRIDVQDANKCVVTQQVSIEKSNVQPDVNFLLSSRMNARDTLAIREICLPAPDNVKWTYHPAAIYLGMKGDVPLIKFNDPGTYWVEMNAHFGECTYTLRKTLEIDPYDPLAGPTYTLPVQVIDTVTLSPNPNNGYFIYNIKLNRKEQMMVYVYDLNGMVAARRQYAPALEVNDSFTVNSSSTGVFILRVITESESRDVRFIISR